MKRKGLLAVMAVALWGSSALAGTVSFSGPTVILPGTDATFDVSVSATGLSSFDTVSILFGSLGGLEMSFVYDPAFVATTTEPPPTPAPFGVYPLIRAGATDLRVEGRNDGSPWLAPVLVGTLTVHSGSSVLCGLQVNPAFEADILGSAVSFVANGTSQDLLSGSLFCKIPEPATMLLLGIGGLFAVVVWCNFLRVPWANEVCPRN